jgi:hypothetical protein
MGANQVKRTASLEMESTVYRGLDDEIEIEVTVEGSGIPYRAATFHDPEEGGVEDVRATFMDGKKERDIPLTDDEVATFEEQLMDQWREDCEDRE